MMRLHDNYHGHHHHPHQKSGSIFLPMLCSRPSIKEVHAALHRPNDMSSSSSSFADPVSPRITCIGQVKRTNNKAVVFPNPHHHHHHRRRLTSSTAKPDAVVKYSKLKRFFSGKNLATAAAAGERPRSLVDELDPPLPVVKRPIGQAQQEEQLDSLWKRRSGGTTLKNLQLHRAHHPAHHLQPTTV